MFLDVVRLLSRTCKKKNALTWKRLQKKLFVIIVHLVHLFCVRLTCLLHMLLLLLLVVIIKMNEALLIIIFIVIFHVLLWTKILRHHHLSTLQHPSTHILEYCYPKYVNKACTIIMMLLVPVFVCVCVCMSHIPNVLSLTQKYLLWNLAYFFNNSQSLDINFYDTFDIFSLLVHV